MISSTHFQYIISKYFSLFVREAQMVAPKKWQAIDAPQPMFELLNRSFMYQIPPEKLLAQEVQPNLPWADIHFEERIGGEPLNPGESYKQWPHYKMDADMRREGEKFSHTYMERFWPKLAGENIAGTPRTTPPPDDPIRGVRYEYGDLNDVFKQFHNDPLTRQAYLPIFFPEDTGNTMNQRVPCSLGYHFIMRDDKMHMVYYIRSCDFLRHFKDDVYLACKLVHWMLNKLYNHPSTDLNWHDVKPGILTMHITSLHVFESDMYRIKKEHDKNNQR